MFDLVIMINPYASLFKSNGKVVHRLSMARTYWRSPLLGWLREKWMYILCCELEWHLCALVEGEKMIYLYPFTNTLFD